MLRAVLDTNVLVSALFGGVPEEVYRSGLRGDFQMVTSATILVELARVLREKISLPEGDITAYVRQISRHSRMVNPAVRLSIVSDEADNRILECAVAAGADAIVSGDRHLLGLGQHTAISILRPADFLTLLVERGRKAPDD